MSRSTCLARDLRTLFATGVVAVQDDAELLDRFLRRSDEAAFTALVARHGPLVLGVCRRILFDPYDVEDAFQATFLVLVRRAASVRVEATGSLGPRLLRVSRRIATRAGARTARQHAREVVAGDDLAAVAPADDVAACELRVAIDKELDRLPARYRRPLVLCDLEELTHEEAARRLRCPVGTVNGTKLVSQRWTRNPSS